MSISIETLALAKAYTDSHGGGGDPSKLGKLAKKDSASGDYKPKGTVSKPNIEVAKTYQSITPIADVGVLPSLMLIVSGKNLTVTFNRGTLPTKSQAINVLSDVGASLAAAPAFSGEQETITVR